MSEPQSPPRLSVVDSPPSEPENETPSRLRSAVPWLLLVAALLFAWLWLNQLEQTQQARAKALELQADVDFAQAQLRAEQARMADVRAAVDRLADDLTVLKALSAPASTRARADSEVELGAAGAE